MLSTVKAALRPRHINEEWAPPGGELALSHFVPQVVKEKKMERKAVNSPENTATVVLKTIDSFLRLPLTT